MKNALNNQVGMLGDMFLCLVANLKQGVIYFIKQEGGNHKTAWVYLNRLNSDQKSDQTQNEIVVVFGIFFCPKFICVSGKDFWWIMMIY